MIVLGIETSCDECSASMVRDGTEVLTNIIASQVDLHREFGGVVPEIAARAHVEAVSPVVAEAMKGYQGTPDAVAVTLGPGLVGSLVVGVAFAKALSWSWGVPLIAVNHVEAHAFAPVLEGMALRFPFMALVVSGGHTLLARVDGVDEMEIVGETLDDAVGESFDKVSKYLDLGYPGGPVIERLSAEGDPSAVRFPRPMIGSGDYNFSYSGLKTAVIRYLRSGDAERGGVSKADIAASFQAAALEVIATKTVEAAVKEGIDRVVVGGGVACNGELRRRILEGCRGRGIEPVFPSPRLCTDNAAMVAALGYLRYRAGIVADLELDVSPGLRLGECTAGTSWGGEGAG